MKPVAKLVDMQFSARDQTVQIKLHGFKFNENGDLIGRRSIRKPDVEKEIFLPKDQRLEDVLPYRHNGMDILNIDELKFYTRQAVMTRDMFACGGYSFDWDATRHLWSAMGIGE